MSHPPQSPDLKPIENLCEELDGQVKKRAISTKSKLKQTLVEEWQTIAQETTQKLVYSMSRRLEVVTKQKALPTKI